MKICPAYAGMILACSVVLAFLANLSRVCGDDPMANCEGIYLSRVCGDDPGRLDLLETETEFVPRMRG